MNPRSAIPMQPAGHAPLRRPHSIRRTSSIDMTWPEGKGKPMRYSGHCRDIYTAAAGDAPTLLREDAFEARIAADHSIEAIAATPPRPGIQALAGKGRGDNLRRLIDELLPDERDAGSPLYLLLDDLPAAILIASWARQHWPEYRVPAEEILRMKTERLPMMEGICIGFGPGSSAFDDFGSLGEKNRRAVVPLPHPKDSQGFHEMTLHTEISMRRARRIDVWQDDLIHIDATFQDSASIPEGGRVAVHEYLLHASADPVTMKLVELEAVPCILPYPECPAAVENIGRLVGLPMSELRKVVLNELRRTLGCTHLNDALRALAEVPALVGQLERTSIAAPAL